MSEEVPRLYLSATDIRQWAEFFVLMSQLSARIRQRRELAARLAQADGEHASRLDDARAEPAVRPMTGAEQREWFSRIPAGLRVQRAESFTVWTAPVAGGWAVEANTWDTAAGTVTSTLLVFCRDDEDAIDLCRWLREHNTPEDLVRLQQTAADAVREPAPTETPVSPEATAGSGRRRVPLVLSEQAWAAALHAQLPPRLANRIIVTDPTHPHHTAWRELWALANEEVWRVGADPVLLARLVREVPTWSENVRKPSALAHWALTEARAQPGYEQAVRPQPAGANADPASSSSTRADEPSVVEGEVVPNRLRLDQVSSPREALRWADGLERSNPQHRLEAKLGVGRWGSEVDAVLARKFPGLMRSTNEAAKRQREREEPGEEEVAVHISEEATLAEAIDTVLRARLLEEVDRLDPARSGDRLHAFALFGHVSSAEVDLELARKFGDDERFAQKLTERYPGGLAEIEHAAAWRGRAEANEQQGAAHMAVPDDPTTPPREDQLAQSTATGDQQTAAAQRSVAATLASTAAGTPPVLPPTEPRRGRSR